ncbi:MAG: hypothetical protein K9W44_16065 [Candidatus Lokiarchaeota archaeon]|nr:hypothetical protein [Candidatus Harpocratesius repetitus]
MNRLKWGLLLGGIVGLFIISITNNPIAIFGYFGLYLCLTVAIFQYFFKSPENPQKIHVISSISIDKAKFD